MTEAAGPAGLAVHATCVAIGGRGVLLIGPPGSGKSDLALRLIDQPGSGTGTATLAARLVADDQVTLRREDDDGLLASAPRRLAGLLEIRGLGIVHLAPAGPVRVVLAARLTPAADIERYPPEKEHVEYLGCRLPVIGVDPAAASAPARVRAGLVHLAHVGTGRDDFVA